MTKTVLILGASGRFGRHAVTAFTNAGWNVRTLQRGQDDLRVAAQGATLIVNGWNPTPDKWHATLPALHKDVLSAAEAAGAAVLLPGNVYPYGTEIPEHVTAQTPMRADHVYGQVRKGVEDSYAKSNVKTIILRAGDFLEPIASGNWFDLVIAKKLKDSLLQAPGDPDAKHAWAFLPDMARATVELANILSDLPNHSDILFRGNTLSINQMATIIGNAQGRNIQVKKMSWLPIRFAAPFWPLGRYLMTMRYLWNQPHELDGTELSQLLPNFQATPVEKVVMQSVIRKPLNQA